MEGIVRVGLTSDDVVVEAQRALADPLGDDVVEAGECTADDEQHIGGVDLDEVLMRMLPTALRRHRCRGALQDLQQGLLDTLAGDITGDRGVLALPGDLVDLVDVDDPGLRLLDIEVGRLNELEQDVLDVLADVAGLGQRGRIRDRERHIEHLGQGLGEVGLTAASGSDQQNVRLRELDTVVLGTPSGIACFSPDALVMVVDGDRQGFLRIGLPDHIAVEEVADLMRLGQLIEQAYLGALGEFFLDDLVAEIDALVADVDARTSDQLLDLLLALPAEGTLQQVAALSDARHTASSPTPDRVARFPTLA